MTFWISDKDNSSWITYVLLSSCLAALPPLMLLHQDPLMLLPRQRIQSQAENTMNDADQAENV